MARQRRGAFAARWWMVGVLLWGATSCLPPPIDDPEDRPPERLYVDHRALDPLGPVVVVERLAGSVYNFEVGGAFRRTNGSSSGLVYYWYIDWALDSPTLMIKDSVTPRLDYRPCSATDDPLPPTQIRPGMRTLVVVASTGELEDPDLAYLGAGEEQAVATYTWTLVFTNECP